MGNSRPLGPMALAVEDSVPVLGKELAKCECFFFPIAIRTGRKGKSTDRCGSGWISGSCQGREESQSHRRCFFFGVGLIV